MPVYKLYLKIVRSKMGQICLYTVLFMFLATMMAANNKSTKGNDFQETSLSIAVADQDNSSLSRHIIDYLDENHNVHTVPYDREALQDALYYNKARYVLILPENFQDALTDGTTKEQSLTLKNVKEPKTPEGFLVDTQLEEYLSLLNTTIQNSESIEQACIQTEQLLKEEAKPSYLNPGQSTEVPDIYYFFHFFPYLFLTLIIVLFGTVLISIFAPEVRKRNYCSAFPLRKFNFHLTLMSVGLGLAMLVILCIIGMILFRSGSKMVNVSYLIGNLLSFTTVSMSIGMLCGFLAPKTNVLTMLANLIGLSFSFLGGVFVEQELLSDAIIPFARLLPSYWYIQNNDLIFKNSTLSSSQTQMLVQNYGLQVLFAAAIFAIAMVVSKRNSSAQ